MFESKVNMLITFLKKNVKNQTGTENTSFQIFSYGITTFSLATDFFTHNNDNNNDVACLPCL